MKVNIFRYIVLLLAGIAFSANAQTDYSRVVSGKILISNKDTVILPFVNNRTLYTEGWHTLAQPIFWKQIMTLSPDSCLINIAGKRTIIDKKDYNSYIQLPKQQRDSVKRNICKINDLDTNTVLYVTSGKKDFYEHRKTIPEIGASVQAFMDNGTDPWYAQTILLIESPGKTTSRSSVGARGPFQLMRPVALRFGLKVNKHIDERTDLYKAAGAAAKLISYDCVPKIKNLLESWNIPYHDTDIFFRLLVLHAYHAGPGNVKCAVDALAPTQGGMDLIVKLWQTECGGFRNESQNYSQIALASLLWFDEITPPDNDTIFMIWGDRYYSMYKKARTTRLSQEELKTCLHYYDKDLVDGTISIDYYLAKTNKLKQELAVLVNPKVKIKTPVYPETETQYETVGNDLLCKRRVNDAITIFQFNMERFPESAVAADSLSRAYRLSGNANMAKQYADKSAELARQVLH